MEPARNTLSRQDWLAMLSRLEWRVLRSPDEYVEVRRWFARASADAPELAFRVGAS